MAARRIRVDFRRSLAPHPRRVPALTIAVGVCLAAFLADLSERAPVWIEEGVVPALGRSHLPLAGGRRSPSRVQAARPWRRQP